MYFNPEEIEGLNMGVSEENYDLEGIRLRVDITVEC